MMKPSDLDQVLRTALATGAKGSFDQLRLSARQFRELLLQRGEAALDDETRRILEEHPDRLQQLYEALADESERADEGDFGEEEDKAFWEVQENQANEYRSIGVAFREGLLARLPENLANLGWLFSDLQPRPDLAEILYEEPDVQAGGGEAKYLASRGLRPLGVFYATEGVALLFDRFQRWGWLRPERAIFLNAICPIPLLTPQERQKEPVPPPLPEGVEFPEALTPDLLFAEVAAMSECPPKAAAPLLRWLVRVAQVKPYVFGRFVASSKEDGVELVRSWVADDDDLRRRWELTKRLPRPRHASR